MNNDQKSFNDDNHLLIINDQGLMIDMINVKWLMILNGQS